MKIVKWGTVIAITVVVTCILVFTFIQEPFRETAPVIIFGYTPGGEFPVYMFVAATFVLGLLIGFFAAAYYYITGRAGIHGKKKEIKRLESLISEKDAATKQMAAELEQLRGMAGNIQKKMTGSMKAVGEKDILL
ncbi:MAG: LapA family protein [Chitinispirillales bacterium]|jgi:uncharacterized membrane protein YciS (DUF1049 family)|nr:LapA family protein [Chitinispirillales bacterium]